MPDAVARNAHTFIVGPVGYNDVDTGRSWASIEADLDNILLQLTDSEQRLACLEILPGRFGTSDAAKKATRNTYNDNYKSWASGKSNVVFIECYDLMSDGSDELQASYHNGDHIHLSPAGAKALAPIVEAAL
jgi:lysophospholipase L1-like esterase